MFYLYGYISGVPKLYPLYFCTPFFIIKGVIFSMSASAIRLFLSSRIFFFCSRAHSTTFNWSSNFYLEKYNLHPMICPSKPFLFKLIRLNRRHFIFQITNQEISMVYTIACRRIKKSDII